MQGGDATRSSYNKKTTSYGTATRVVVMEGFPTIKKAAESFKMTQPPSFAGTALMSYDAIFL